MAANPSIPIPNPTGSSVYPHTDDPAMADWKINYVLLVGKSEYPREIVVPAKSQKAAKDELDRLIDKSDGTTYKVRSCVKITSSKKQKSR